MKRSLTSIGLSAPDTVAGASTPVAIKAMRLLTSNALMDRSIDAASLTRMPRVRRALPVARRRYAAALASHVPRLRH